MYRQIEMTLWTEVVSDMEGHGVDVRDDYSGRGMFGDRCIAVCGNLGDLIRFIRTVVVNMVTEDDDPVDLLDDLAESARQDSMGTGTVYYFPGVTVAS